MMKFVLFLALGIAALATIAAFATGSENSTDGRKYDYWTSSDVSLPVARRFQSFPRPTTRSRPTDKPAALRQ